MGDAARGFSGHVTTTIPVGAGLSSSAALEVALLRAFREAFMLPLDDVQMALLAQRAENDFDGAPVGVMDQMACTLASDGEALFLDTRSLEWKVVPLPPSAELVVFNSGIAHNHSKGDYRTRRAECEDSARQLGVKQLRDLDVPDVPRIMALPDPLGRRARHVVTENARVLDAVRALQAGNIEALGALFYASHDSMRDDYEVSVPEIDLIVELARAMPEVHGARLTGGGFGGSVVILARPGTAADVAQKVSAAYTAKTGRSGAVLVPQAAGA
jgi:galactokinase